ncbi:hypothetical protein [Corynebacterium variabile]|uniref:hypothetical protein n=1 Tax=Corynebacterium variabile TaxID=1727 RepID=UPI00289CEBF6|nr:hypothetical protein [Corynebacterium variabile]
MNITPDQARELLDGATPGPWMLNPHGCILVDDGTDDPPGPHGFIGTMYRNDPDDTANGELMAAAPDLAQTIAGMEWEYGLRQPRPEPHAEGELYTSWGYRLFAAKAAFAGLTDRGVECYIVRRLVGPVEVTE